MDSRNADPKSQRRRNALKRSDAGRESYVAWRNDKFYWISAVRTSNREANLKTKSVGIYVEEYILSRIPSLGELARRVKWWWEEKKGRRAFDPGTVTISIRSSLLLLPTTTRLPTTALAVSILAIVD
jgi:hypothetical protein